MQHGMHLAKRQRLHVACSMASWPGGAHHLQHSCVCALRMGSARQPSEKQAISVEHCWSGRMYCLQHVYPGSGLLEAAVKDERSCSLTHWWHVGVPDMHLFTA